MYHCPFETWRGLYLPSPSQSSSTVAANPASPVLKGKVFPVLFTLSHRPITRPVRCQAGLLLLSCTLAPPPCSHTSRGGLQGEVPTTSAPTLPSLLILPSRRPCSSTEALPPLQMLTPASLKAFHHAGNQAHIPPFSTPWT